MTCPMSKTCDAATRYDPIFHGGFIEWLFSLPEGAIVYRSNLDGYGRCVSHELYKKGKDGAWSRGGSTVPFDDVALVGLCDSEFFGSAHSWPKRTWSWGNEKDLRRKRLNAAARDIFQAAVDNLNGFDLAETITAFDHPGSRRELIHALMVSLGVSPEELAIEVERRFMSDAYDYKSHLRRLTVEYLSESGNYLPGALEDAKDISNEALETALIEAAKGNPRKALWHAVFSHVFFTAAKTLAKTMKERDLQ